MSANQSLTLWNKDCPNLCSSNNIQTYSMTSYHPKSCNWWAKQHRTRSYINFNTVFLWRNTLNLQSNKIITITLISWSIQSLSLQWSFSSHFNSPVLCNFFNASFTKQTNHPSPEPWTKSTHSHPVPLGSISTLFSHLLRGLLSAFSFKFTSKNF